MITRISIFLVIFSLASIAHAFELKQIPKDSVLRGNFTQDRLIPGFKSPLHSEGNFVVTEQGIIWKTEKPFASTVVINKEGLTQEVNNNKIVIDSNKIPSLEHIMIMIHGMLAGNWSILAKDFNITERNLKNSWQVDLIPKISSDAIPINSMHLTGSEFVDQVSMIRKDKSTDTLLFSNQKISSLRLSPEEQSSFLPNMKPNSELNDATSDERSVEKLHERGERTQQLKNGFGK